MKHTDIRLIIVVGSIGKTTTKIAIARMLSEQYAVRMHEGDPRSRIDTMLQLLGIDYPGNKNSPLAWLSILRAAKQRIEQPSDTQYIIQELDPWKAGASTFFEGIIRPDITVVTGISDGPIRGFGSIEEKAKEILQVANFSKYALVNRDDSDGRFAAFLTNANISTYGVSGTAEHRFIEEDSSLFGGHKGLLSSPLAPHELPIEFYLAGEKNVRPGIAACVIGLLAGMQPEAVVSAATRIKPLAGRMNILRGVRGSTIIDDSYGATYPSAMAALQMLYAHQAPQRIAVFGDMLATPEEHEALGAHCDGIEIQWLVTVGEKAERYLAPQAKAQGCQVRSFRNAMEAGVFIGSVLEDKGLVLFKGASEGIYLEEAIKIILHSTADEKLLPRQTQAELDAKAAYFVKE